MPTPRPCHPPIGLPRALATAVLALALSGGAASAQSIDNALRAYRSNEFPEAALAFYDVFAHDTNPDTQDQAEIYLADSLFKLELYMPALYYYSDIFKAGPGNRYYLNAIEGLLQVRRQLHDHFLVPTLINAYYNPEGYGQLEPAAINEINYLIGAMSYFQGKYGDAQSFLEFIPPEASLRYFQARYLLGMIALRRGDAEGAISLLRGVVDAIDPADADRERHRMWQLAVLGIARGHYGIGNYKMAVEWFSKIPRFDGMWFEALYEVAWAYFQLEDHGRALGALQSLAAPYFAKRHSPEAPLIAATTYFVNCQWDRVRRTIEQFNGAYQPMVEGLKAYLGRPQEPIGYYNDVVGGGAGKLDLAIAREVRRTQRFLDFHHLLSHLDWELQQARTIKTWQGSQLVGDLENIISQQRGDLQNGIGVWVRGQLQYQLDLLQGFLNQASIIEFEVADAEKRWLEAGKNIIKGKRARLPRPEIPSDQWQHWNFRQEYWIDEIGYYVHSVKSECFEGLEAE